MKRGDVVLVRFPHPSGQRGNRDRNEKEPELTMSLFPALGPFSLLRGHEKGEDAYDLGHDQALPCSYMLHYLDSLVWRERPNLGKRATGTDRPVWLSLAKGRARSRRGDAVSH
jgi:hypothetical protein